MLVTEKKVVFEKEFIVKFFQCIDTKQLDVFESLLDALCQHAFSTKSTDCARASTDDVVQAIGKVDEAISQSLSNILGCTIQGNQSILNEIKKLNEARSDDPVASAIIGSRAEEQVFNALTDSLKRADGYTIERIGSTRSRSCDIRVSHETKCPIAVEVKKYKNPVNRTEVQKFYRDLENIGCHGVFVSLTSGIVGISNFEIHTLSNNKYAFFLTNNNFDTDIIIGAIKILHKLDANGTTDPVLSKDCVDKIVTRLREYVEKIKILKMHSEEIRKITHDIALNEILDLFK